MGHSTYSISALVSELRIYLKESKDKCKTNLKRYEFVEDIYSLMPMKEIYNKYYPNSNLQANSVSKNLNRICKYAGLIKSVNKKDIIKCAKKEAGLHEDFVLPTYIKVRRNIKKLIKIINTWPVVHQLEINSEFEKIVREKIEFITRYNNLCA